MHGTMRLSLLLGGAALGACSLGTQSADWSIAGRAPREVPERFVRDTAVAAPPGSDPAAAPQQGCWVRLIDPRDGGRLTLRRSGERFGDYVVASVGRYGVGAGEHLRIDCTTGRAVGIVPGGA